MGRGYLRSSFHYMSHIPTATEASALLAEHADWALQRHCHFVASAMSSLCQHFGSDSEQDLWYSAGLLHDLDWNRTIDTPQEHCGAWLEELFAQQQFSAEILEVIRSHHDIYQIPRDSLIKKALFCVDELSGFSVAVAQMRPTGMLGISPSSITKKMKDKRFAAAVSRADMRSCEDLLGLSVSELLQILIPDWEQIALQWDLVRK